MATRSSKMLYFRINSGRKDGECVHRDGVVATTSRSSASDEKTDVRLSFIMNGSLLLQ